MPLALSLGVLLAALAAPAGAATGDPVGASQAGEQSILIWAYFDGDTPVSGGRVHVYANGHELQGDGIAGSDVRTFSDGTALVRLDRLPSKLRVVISGGRAGGRPVRGSLKTSVDGADVGDVIEVNPVTTVAEIYAHREDGSDHHARDVTERTLGIPLVLNDADLYATDRWFGGDRFQRWTLEHGSVEEGARSLVRLAEEPGVDRHLFRPPDRGGAEARAAADPVGKGVDTILDGIIDHIATAASGSGLHGIVFGLALKGIKAAITDGLSGQEQSEVNGVEAQLTEISTRLAALENQLKDVVFQLKADNTAPLLNKIDAAQRDLDWAVTAKEPGWKPGKPDPPPLGTQARKDIFNAGAKKFVDKAEGLVKDDVAGELNQKLAVQTGGGTPPLITGFRAYVARNTRFFTSHNSEEIDRFFDYYKEYETRLAVLLSEYYTYRGDPTLTVGENLASAERDVKQIKNVSLPAQRALMPQAELAPLVFIDCGPDNCERAKDNALMWRTEPTYRSSKDITADGNFSKCTAYAAGDNPNCRLDTKKRFNGYADDWRPPLMSEAKQLFANHTGDTIPWMNKAGVGFKPAIRFPGYDPSALTYPVSLWVRDGWRIDVPGGRLLDQYTITTQQLTLEARGGGALKDPAEIHSWIANHFSCRVGNTHRELPSVPSCSDPNRSTGGFILWQRSTTKAERNKYW